MANSSSQHSASTDNNMIGGAQNVKPLDHFFEKRQAPTPKIGSKRAAAEPADTLSNMPEGKDSGSKGSASRSSGGGARKRQKRSVGS